MKQDDNAISTASVLHIFFVLIKNHEAEPFKARTKNILYTKVKFTLHFYFVFQCFQ